MKWSLKLGRFAGVDVFVHWTFLILLVWIFVAHLGAGQDVNAALRGVGFVLALFGCVVLHEFGHALAARRYGIHTRDITLLPIGGVARLERMPENPRHELWVALAGPAVNVVIAGALFAALAMRGGAPQELELAASLASGDFAARLMTVNVFLAVFNDSCDKASRVFTPQRAGVSGRPSGPHANAPSVRVSAPLVSPDATAPSATPPSGLLFSAL